MRSEMLKLIVVVGLVAGLACGQKLINRVRVEDKAEGTGECWLKVVNTEEILDIRTTCPLGNSTHAPNFQRMIQLVKPAEAYLIQANGVSIYGYRYIKDPLNYWFAFYDFEVYHTALAQQMALIGLTSVIVPFEERYTLALEYCPKSDYWFLITLDVSFHSAQALSISSNELYKVRTWMVEPSRVEKSLATRRLAGRGDSQPLNVTLELSAKDQQIIDASAPGSCKVTIEEILPEWFFVSYDDLHTMDKFEVFDIELPAHFAKQYFFRYYVPLAKFTEIAPQTYRYHYMMRIRYPPPGEEYTVTVGLHPNDKITVECEAGSFVVEEDLLSDRGHTQMFAGKESDAQMVTMATYAIALIVCVWSLRKHKKTSGM